MEQGTLELQGNIVSLSGIYAVLGLMTRDIALTIKYV
jgi:hypothetical protein